MNKQMVTTKDAWMTYEFICNVCSYRHLSEKRQETMFMAQMHEHTGRVLRQYRDDNYKLVRVERIA